jgi:hypothetical protein
MVGLRCRAAGKFGRRSNAALPKKTKGERSNPFAFLLWGDMVPMTAIVSSLLLFGLALLCGLVNVALRQGPVHEHKPYPQNKLIL